MATITTTTPVLDAGLRSAVTGSLELTLNLAMRAMKPAMTLTKSKEIFA
jgi:hypothetical protein